MAPYQIKSNLSEKQIEADVAMYLGWCSRGLPFRLLDIDEQITGADKKFDAVVPIYVQFKKTNGLRPSTDATKTRRKGESKLQKVRRYRKLHHLSDDPTLYFGLRAKAPTAPDFQHNILLAHNRPGISHAIYVAPLCLDKLENSALLCSGARYLNEPWTWRQWELHEAHPSTSWLSRYDFQPYLRNHISITPHERVADHRHYYGFSEAGDEVSWHSPETLDGGNSRLSDFLTSRVKDLLFDEEPNTPSDVLAYLKEMEFFDGLDRDVDLAGETPIEQLQSYGRWLNKNAEIRQFLLCGDRNDLKDARSIIDSRF